MFLILAIVVSFFLFGMASPNTQSKIAGGAMAGTAMGCFYLLFVLVVIIFAIPAIIFLMGSSPVILALAAISVPALIFILRVSGN